MKIIERAVEYYGVKNQLIVAIEELSELQKELCKCLRNQQSREHIVEELADVMIVIEQLREIFNIPEGELETYIGFKTARLLRRIDYESEKGV